MTAPVKPSGPATASPSAFIAQLIAGVLAANLFVAALIGLSIHRSYQQQQESAEVTTQNLAKVLESEVAGILKNDDMALLSVLDEYQKQRAASGVDKKALNAYIERVHSRLPEMDALRITDAQGLLIFGSGVIAATRTSLADRPHFIRLRDDPKAGLVISQPHVSRINQKWVIVLARRIDQPDGTFGGMVFAAISLEHLSGTFSDLNVGPRGIITLREGDMGIVIRHPEPSGVGSVIGQKTAPAPLRKMVLAGQKAGTYTALSTVDGTERTFSFRRVGNYPLLIIVGLATDDYLAEWRDDNAKLAGMAALFILISAVAAWMTYRSWKHRMDSTEALARQETRFRTMADYTYDWEYWQGPNREILYMTPSCERVTGYASAEFVADPGLLQRIVHPDDQQVMDRHLHDIAHQEGAMTDFRIVRRDGEIRWIAHHCHAIHGKNGEPMGRRVSNRDITERKCVEEALRENEKKFHATFEGSNDAIMLLTAKGFFDCNARTLEIFGLKNKAEFVACHPSDLSPPFQPDGQDSLSAANKQIMTAFQQGSNRFEWVHRRMDGEDFTAEVLLSAFNYGGEKVLQATVRDISERKRAEEALQASETKLHAILDSAPIGIWLIGVDGRYRFVNKTFCNAVGIPESRFLTTQNLPDLLGEEMAANCQKSDRECFEKDTPHLSYEMLNFVDGKPHLLEITKIKLRDETGKTIGAIGTAIDITERKSAENALQESEARLHELFENMSNGVAVYQPSADGLDFIFTAMNQAAECIENVKRDDLIGKNVKDIFPGVVKMGLLDVFRRVWQSGKAEHFPVSHYQDGRISSWRENYVYKLPSGEIVAIYNDITERKKAEMQLRELNETLEHRVNEAVHQNMEHERLLIQQSRLAAMGEMIGNIAHQWRQPLNALALLQANVKDDFEYGELNQESMDRFVADGQRIIQKMSSTIDDFRDFFKPQKEKKPFLVQEIVKHTLDIVNAGFKNHNIVVTVKEESDIQVTGYPNELSQVLLNVLNNAKDALLDRKVADGKIDITINQDEGMAWIAVRDNAGGIFAETLPKIFDPYFTTREKGTGIGLYMSRMIMEHMNGAIEARNVEGGAEFRLAIPKSST